MKKANSIQARELTSIGVFAALIAVMSQVFFYLPVSPAPVTLSLVGVFLAAATLPTRSAMMSLAVYLLLGAVGAPVFAGFKGGAAVLAGPTGGYLVGYFFSALIICLLKPRDESIKRGEQASGPDSRRAARFAAYALIFTAAFLACYLFGTLWMMVVQRMSFLSVIGVAVVPFLAGDVLKALACAAIAPELRARYKRIQIQSAK